MEELKFNSQESREQIRMKKLSDIEPLEDHHYEVENREDLAQLVEVPLLGACQNLFDKNIQTYMSSANKKDVGGNASFSIIYNTLSEENKEVSQKLIEEHIAEYIAGNEVYPTRIQVNIPVNEQTTLGDIEDESSKIVDRFVKQRRWFTPSELMDKFYLEIENDISGGEVNPEYFEKHGYFYDVEENMFFKGDEKKD